MMRIEDKKLIFIAGGAFDSSFINAFVRLVNSFIEVGKMIGSSIRRAVTKNYC